MLGQSNSSTVINYIKLENQDITVTENGVYEADERHTGLGKVTVNVSVSGGDKITATNATNSAIVEGQKVYINSQTSFDNVVSYEVVDFSSVTENSLTGKAIQSADVNDQLEVLTILVESSEPITNAILMKSGDKLVTKAGDNIVYK